MPWIIGHKRSRELLYLGDTISAARAEELGMINQVVAEADLEAETIRYAERLALIGREALGACKLAVNRGIEATGFRNALNAGVGVVGLLHTSKVDPMSAFTRRSPRTALPPPSAGATPSSPRNRKARRPTCRTGP